MRLSVVRAMMFLFGLLPAASAVNFTLQRITPTPFQYGVFGGANISPGIYQLDKGVIAYLGFDHHLGVYINIAGETQRVVDQNTPLMGSTSRLVRINAVAIDGTNLAFHAVIDGGHPGLVGTFGNPEGIFKRFGTDTRLVVDTEFHVPIPSVNPGFSRLSGGFDIEDDTIAFIGDEVPANNNPVVPTFLPTLYTDVQSQLFRIADHSTPAPGTGSGLGTMGEVSLQDNALVLSANGGGKQQLYRIENGSLFSLLAGTAAGGVSVGSFASSANNVAFAYRKGIQAVLDGALTPIAAPLTQIEGQLHWFTYFAVAGIHGRDVYFDAGYDPYSMGPGDFIPPFILKNRHTSRSTGIRHRASKTAVRTRGFYINRNGVVTPVRLLGDSGSSDGARACIRGHSMIFGRLFPNMAGGLDHIVYRANEVGWEPRPVPADYDGDGMADIAFYEPSDAGWAFRRTSTGTGISQFGYEGVVPSPADYDGDAKADVAVYDQRYGAWYLQRTADGFHAASFGFPGTVPVPADFDGDGRVDLGLYHADSGTWFASSISSGHLFEIQFGYPPVIPVPADYDGDGRADLSVYDPDQALWYVHGSTGSFSITPIGPAGALPVPADFDGDGTTDLAVYERATGNWSILASTAGPSVTQFGFAEATPFPRDFDADGKDDLAVYDYPNHTWYIFGSTAGFLIK